MSDLIKVPCKIDKNLLYVLTLNNNSLLNNKFLYNNITDDIINIIIDNLIEEIHRDKKFPYLFSNEDTFLRLNKYDAKNYERKYKLRQTFIKKVLNNNDKFIFKNYISDLFEGTSRYIPINNELKEDFINFLKLNNCTEKDIQIIERLFVIKSEVSFKYICFLYNTENNLFSENFCQLICENLLKSYYFNNTASSTICEFLLEFDPTKELFHKYLHNKFFFNNDGRYIRSAVSILSSSKTIKDNIDFSKIESKKWKKYLLGTIL